METTNSLVCAACNTPSSDGQKFCLNCGEGLWYPCPECEQSNPINSGFCGACGCDLRSILKESEEFFENAIQQAKDKAVDLDLNAAIRILLAAADSAKLHLKSQKNQLRDLVKNYREQKNEQKADIEDRFEKANHLYENSSLNSALKILSDIPQEIRSAEAEELLTKIQFEFDESKRLATQIEKLVKNKELLNALPPIKQLLQIKPNDDKLKKLANDILNRVVRSVEKLKQEGKYSEAFALIRRVGDSGSSETINSLTTEIREIVWLANFVKKAQSVDAGLVKGIDVLANTTASYENKKLLVEVTNRFKTAQTTNGKTVGWSTAPKELSFGIPANICDPQAVIEGFDSISIDGSSQLNFQVAAGLALQGIGKAAISTELMDQKKSFFGFGGKKTAKAAWGIDFGASSLKAVRLSCENQDAINLESAEQIPYRNLDPNGSNSDQRSNMLEALLRLKAKHDIKKDAVISTALNPNQVLGRYLTLPDGDAKAFKSALEFEVKHQIPFPMDDVIWDHFVFPIPSGNKKFAFVSAARKTDADLISEMFTANGMKLTSLQSESVAIYNYHQLAAAKAGSTACTAVLDIGYTSSTLTFVSPHRIWFRTFGTGTHSFVKALSRSLKTTTEQAVELLHDLRKSENDIAKALLSIEPPYRDLVTEISRSIKGFENDLEEASPDSIVCIGGGTKLPGLLTYLRHDLESLTV